MITIIILVKNLLEQGKLLFGLLTVRIAGLSITNISKAVRPMGGPARRDRNNCSYRGEKVHF